MNHLSDNTSDATFVALVNGEPFIGLPQDLYIPPDALRVFLESFEGPLDLLLYLIRKENIDILNIPIAPITEQYIGYIDMMLDFKMDLVGEYLLMAATLAEIKSRMLLPKPIDQDGEKEEEDPRATLMKRLATYEVYRKASENLNQIPRCERDFYLACAYAEKQDLAKLEPNVSLEQLFSAFAEVLQRSQYNQEHIVTSNELSIRERMSEILTRLSETPEQKFLVFDRLFNPKNGRFDVICSFLALLELLKSTLVDITQENFQEPIYIRLQDAN